MKNDLADSITVSRKVARMKLSAVVSSYLLVVGSLVLAVTAPLLRVYHYNQAHFDLSFLEVILIGASVGVLASPCFLPLLVTRARAIGVHVAAAILVSAVLSTFIVPIDLDVVDGGGPVDLQTRSSAWNAVVAVLLVYAAVGLLFLSRNDALQRVLGSLLRVAPQLGAAYVILFSVYAVANSENTFGLEALVTESDRSPILLGEDNVFILSFDQVQGSMFSGFLELDEPERKEVLEDFVFFPDAASTYPNTNYSLASLYLGRRVMSSEEHARVVIDSEESIFAEASDYGYEVRTNQASERYDRLSLNVESSSNRAGRVAELLVHGVNLGFGLDVTNVLSVVSRGRLRMDLIQYIWMDDLGAFADFIERLEAVEDGGQRFYFLHFLGTHQPFVYDSSCRFKPEEVIRLNQSVSGALDEIRCMTGLIERFLSKLKDLGAYEDAVIFIVSDHGYERNINAFETQEEFEGYFFYNSSIVGKDNIKPAGAYNPLFLVKVSGLRGMFRRDGSPVSLIDVAPTICELIVGCDRAWEGESILGAVDDLRERKFWRYFGGAVRRDPDGINIYHGGLDEYWRVERFQGGLTPGLVSALLEEDELPVRLFFTKEGDPEGYLRNGWSGQGTNFRWTDGHVADVLIRLEGDPQGLAVRLRTGAYLGGGLEAQHVTVVANGEQVGAWEVSALDWYEVVIPAALMGDGLLQLKFEISNPTAPCDVSESRDCRELGLSVRELVLEHRG